MIDRYFRWCARHEVAGTIINLAFATFVGQVIIWGGIYLILKFNIV